MSLRHVIPVVACLVLAGCFSGVQPPRDTSVVVFVLDTPMDVNFVEGRGVGVAGRRASHGSLVGRVLRSHCQVAIIPIDVTGAGRGIGTEGYVAGLRQVLARMQRDPRARVLVNISLASDRPDDAEHALIRSIDRRGGLVVAAAGNGGDVVPLYPAAYPEVIAVAAGGAGGRAPTSSFGPHVDITASGDVTFIDDEFLPYQWLRRQTEAHGTSFATPRVVAALARMMHNDADLTPRQAFRKLCAMVRPLDDKAFRDGLLGVGLVDPATVRRSLSPGYRLVHFVLPVCIWAALAVATVWLCLRRGLVGLFLSLMMWLVLLPATVLLFLEFRGYLFLAGAGSAGRGLAATAIIAAGALGCAVIQKGSAAKAAVAALPPFGAFLALCAAGVAVGGGPLPAAAGAAAVAMTLAAVLELRTRRLLRALAALPGGAWGGSEALVRCFRLSLDRRVRRALLDALGRTADETAIAFLLEFTRGGPMAGDALDVLSRASLSAFAPWVESWPSLDQAARDAVMDVLERKADPAAVPFLEELVAVAPMPRAERLLDELRIRAP